jgi:hypothetical protein
MRCVSSRLRTAVTAIFGGIHQFGRTIGAPRMDFSGTARCGLLSQRMQCFCRRLARTSTAPDRLRHRPVDSSLHSRFHIVERLAASRWTACGRVCPWSSPTSCQSVFAKNLFGDRLLAALHDHVRELGQHHAVERGSGRTTRVGAETLRDINLVPVNRDSSSRFASEVRALTSPESRFSSLPAFRALRAVFQTWPWRRARLRRRNQRFRGWCDSAHRKILTRPPRIITTECSCRL